MHRAFAHALTMLTAVAFCGCNDKAPSGPAELTLNEPPPPAGTLVSNPVRNSAGIGSNVSGLSMRMVSATSVYVSASPGTFPGAVSADVRNTTRNSTAKSLVVIDGGFDPVTVDAVEGDELSLTVFTKNGEIGTFAVKVPPRLPPKVVRTNPAKGRIDVALNVQIVIVFSEPVDKTTATPGAIRLLKSGSQVSGKVVLSADGLSAAIVPDAPLDPESAYDIEIGQAVRDLDGDPLATASSIGFITKPVDAEATLLFANKIDGHIYSIGADGTGLTPLTSAPQRDVNPRSSPDGRRIAFARNFPSSANRGAGVEDIFIANADGSNAVQRTFGGYFSSAAWSPDGRKLLLSDEETYYAHIYVIGADDDGNEPVLLQSDGRSPQWSPDGRKIVYVHTSGDDGYHQIYLMDADGKNAHALTEIDPGGIQGVTWSPDGKQIAFSKCLVQCNIYKMNADGSELQPMAMTNVADLTWSPDGLWIAFTAIAYSSGQFKPSVQYIPATGGSLRLVVSDGYLPSWRP